MEDNPYAKILIGQMLGRAGMAVVPAETGEEALQLVQDRPDLVLLDLELPDMSGFEICRRIKAHPQTALIPVLTLTAKLIQPSDWASSLEGGADAYLSQPVDEGVLIATIRTLLRARDAEAEVRRSAAGWQATFDALSVGICLLDANGTPVRMNAAAVEAGHSERAAELFEDVRRDGKRQTSEFSANGRWFALTVDPVYDDAGRVGGGVAAAYDITERKRMEDELARSNSEFKQFAYIASHDLQEPLRMVSSYLALLERRYKGKLDASADDFIHFAVDGAKRMSELIQDLLAFSRAGNAELNLAPIETRDALKRALANLEVAIREAGVAIEVSELPKVTADLRQVAQVFQNLVSNAIKFRADAPPRVEIGATAAGSEYEFFVRDNGVGIAPDDHARIFEMFGRARANAKRPGTGLGLSIVKRIVERHGGRVWVESTPGCGSTFRFTLPSSERRPLESRDWDGEAA